jgi:hypothetical protein
MSRELIRQQLAGWGELLIRTWAGEEILVPHPEFILVGRHNIVVAKANGLLDIIDPLRVVSIRPATRRKPQKGEE